MYKLRLMLMRKKPTMLDYVQPEMPKKAKVVFLASFDDAKKEQDRMLKKAKALSK